MSNWHTIDFYAYKAPAEPACYVFYFDGKIAYIGQTGNLKKRLGAYNVRFGYGGGVITPWGHFQDVALKVNYGTRFGDWAMRELRLIRRLQPPWNCVGSIKRRAA